MKRVITLIIATIAFISCNNKQKNISNIGNENLIKTYFEHFNNHDWNKMANMYAEITDFKDPSLGLGVVKQTKQQTIDKYKELNKIFADLHDKVIQIYFSGDKHVTVEFVSSGTSADKIKFELPICTIFTIENGLIVKDFTYFDNFDENK